MEGTGTETAELSLDQQLDNLFKGSETPLGDKTKPGAAPEPGKEALPGTDEDPLEKALSDIKEGEDKPEEKAPQLSDDQQAVLHAVPDAQTATRLFQVVENYQNFVGTFEKGDYEAVESMFQNWNPTAYENFLEHIYRQYMVNGDWAERFIAEAEGRGPERKGMKGIEKKIADLESKLKQKDEGEAQGRQAAEQARIAQNYENYVNGLFDTINFSKADRKWVFTDLNSRVSADPNAMQAVRSGNLSAVNKLFKTAVREYVNRDKQVSTEKDAKIEQQNQKRLPLSGGVGAPAGDELPSDVKQVPKGQEDNWMMQELGKLAKKVGLKK